MFVFGRGHKQITIGDGLSIFCSNCGNTGPHSLVIDYDYAHIFWAFKDFKNKTSKTTCLSCGTESTVSDDTEKTIYERIGGNPMPFTDRFGGVVFVGLIAAWLLFAFWDPCWTDSDSSACAASQITSSDNLVSGSEVPNETRQLLVSNGVLYEDEQIQLLYAFGYSSVLEGGSILTDRAVITYFEGESDGLEAYEIPFDQISSVEVYQTTTSERLYKASSLEEDYWILIQLPTFRGLDREFVDALKMEIQDASSE